MQQKTLTYALIVETCLFVTIFFGNDYYRPISCDTDLYERLQSDMGSGVARIWRPSTAKEAVQLRLLNSMIMCRHGDDNQCDMKKNDKHINNTLLSKSQQIQNDVDCDWVLIPVEYIEPWADESPPLHFKMDLVASFSNIFMIDEPKYNLDIITNFNDAGVDHEYTRNHLKYDANWRIQLRIGSLLDCLDTDLRRPKWYKAFIKDIVNVHKLDAKYNKLINYNVNLRDYNKTADLLNREFEIKYVGYSDRFNVWVKFDSDRLAPLFTYTENYEWPTN